MGSVREKLKKKDKYSTKGGGSAYHLVRSKIQKSKDGYGMPVSVEREQAMQKAGKVLPYNTVVMHESFGSHSDPKGDPWHLGTRGENSSESNKHRAAVRKRLMKK